MTDIYGEQHRALQQDFATEQLADAVSASIVLPEIPDMHKGFIETRDFFFLTTIDHRGFPTCSYKGGNVGFVRVLDRKTLAFPSFDGNGMFLSMGNITANPRIGMLFIDFETPHRVRVQGLARLVRDHALMAEYAEAKYLIFVEVSKIWVNCPRYIHKYKKLEPSKYVPEPCKVTPIPAWKRLDMVQDAITPAEKTMAEQQGLIDLNEYEEKVKQGEG